ncbi:MAG: Holliday junction resolvase RuvX [Saprospiraceae bacterium]|nr:Holliday junction resolvase RuvX [Saprospiraceae bacterium]
MGIDYGKVRTGIAVTDPLRIICSPLTTLPTGTLESFLDKYISEEKVDDIIFGEPLHSDGTPTAIHAPMMEFVEKLKKKYPNISIHLQDEAFSSVEAKRITSSKFKKQKRRDKSLVDKVSASLILREFLEMF